jgi:Predicted periplasmic protein (DUF2271)
MQKKLLLMVCTLLSGAATAADLSVSIEVPRLNVAEYHRPYVAAWLERPDQSVAAHLNVWYDVNYLEESSQLLIPYYISSHATCCEAREIGAAPGPLNSALRVPVMCVRVPGNR